MGDGLDFRSPKLVWDEYIQNYAENEENRANEAERVFENLAKKISGIPVEDSFQEFNNQIQDLVKDILSGAEEELLQITDEELAEIGFTREDISNQLGQAKEDANNLKPLPITENEELGSAIFRDWLKQKGIQMRDLPAKDVIPTLQELFVQASGNPNALEQFCDSSIPSNILRDYNLMNWTGYFPDDFTKIKKKKDRFRASQIDMRHVANAMACNYLVSSDFAFSRKAKSCYLHINSPAIVVTPQELIDNYL